MKIKVCGNTEGAQLIELNDLPVDYAGLIFYPQSPRCILKKMSGKEVKESVLITKVGVLQMQVKKKS